ncbi:hypothetical protein Bca4012_075737 [Brassica carinata]
MKSLYLCSSLSTMNHSASLSVALLDDEKLLSLSRWLSSAKNHSTSLSMDGSRDMSIVYIRHTRGLQFQYM